MSELGLTSKTLNFESETEAAEHFDSQGWTDGLPIVPPTQSAVESFLRYSGRSPAEIVLTEPVKGRVVTAEKVAVNAVMAGCRPEDFPVVLAAVDAMDEPEFNLHAISASTMGAAVLIVVNGPIAGELGMNSGVSVFGPGNRANATIGRAIRLIIANATGASPGGLDKATLGHPGKLSFCIAEAEEVSPWEPLHVERGLPSGSSAVTLFAGQSPIQVGFHESTEPKAILGSFADALFAAGPQQTEIVVVIAPEHVGHLRAAGWSKARVKEQLAEAARRTVGDWVAAGRLPPESGQGSLDTLLGVAREPESITLLVAGGAAGGFSAVIPLWSAGAGSRSVIKEIEHPAPA